MSAAITAVAFAVLVLARMVALGRALVASGWPEVSPWWSELLSAFMRSGARQLVVRCGRRGGKSSTACIFAVAFALVYSTLGLVPPGDVGWVVFVSVSREEADQRLKTIAKILTAIGVPFAVEGQTILLTGTNIGFRVQACTVSSVSGWTTILIIADEVAKWLNREDGSNPASEVLSALRPTAATQPLARILLLSSPVGMADAHAVAFEGGTGPHQMVAAAASWIANPSISEEDTRRLEPDPRVHAREYGAVPQAGALSAFDVMQIDRAMRTVIPADWTVCERIVLVDPTAGSSDTYAFAVAGWRKQRGGDQALLEIRDVGGVAEADKHGVTSDKMVRDVSALARRHDADAIHSDQFEKFSLASAFANRGATFVPHTWSAANKERCVEHVRGWLRDGMLALPKHDRLRHELLAFEERIAPSGALTFRGRQGGHDDYCMLVMLAALVDIEGGLPGSPSGKRVAGQGLLEWYMASAAALEGGPSPLVVEDPPELVEMTVPPKMVGSSTYMARSGNRYGIEHGRIRAKASDIQDLRFLGFQFHVC
ncbi:MAG TPA: hypothetical protein VGM06_05550 [Polyangiaceae bacterium]